MAPVPLTWYPDESGSGGAFQAYELVCALFGWDASRRADANQRLSSYNLQPKLQSAIFPNTKCNETPIIRHR